MVPGQAARDHGVPLPGVGPPSRDEARRARRAPGRPIRNLLVAARGRARLPPAPGLCPGPRPPGRVALGNSLRLSLLNGSRAGQWFLFLPIGNYAAGQVPSPNTSIHSSDSSSGTVLAADLC